MYNAQRFIMKSSPGRWLEEKKTLVSLEGWQTRQNQKGVTAGTSHTFFGRQGVFLLGFGLLQLGLVEVGDFRDVRFVSHFCRRF